MSKSKKTLISCNERKFKSDILDKEAAAIKTLFDELKNHLGDKKNGNCNKIATNLFTKDLFEKQLRDQSLFSRLKVLEKFYHYIQEDAPKDLYTQRHATWDKALSCFGRKQRTTTQITQITLLKQIYMATVDDIVKDENHPLFTRMAVLTKAEKSELLEHQRSRHWIFETKETQSIKNIKKLRGRTPA